MARVDIGDVCVLLKARAAELAKLDVRVYHNDVCNSSHMLDVMTSHGISHVVHLAAQAGVRYSLRDPLSYVTANIDCLLVLLDVLRRFPVFTQLAYYAEIIRQQCPLVKPS